MVGIFLEDWIPHEYYSYAGSLQVQVSLQTSSFFYQRHFSIFSKVGYRVGLHVDTSIVSRSCQALPSPKPSWPYWDQYHGNGTYLGLLSLLWDYCLRIHVGTTPDMCRDLNLGWDFN